MHIQLGTIRGPLRPSVCVTRLFIPIYFAMNEILDLYYIAFPRDGWGPKALVYSVYLLETAQTVLLTYDIYDTYVRHFGDADVLNSVKHEWISIPILSSIRRSPSND